MGVAAEAYQGAGGPAEDPALHPSTPPGGIMPVKVEVDRPVGEAVDW